MVFLSRFLSHIVRVVALMGLGLTTGFAQTPQGQAIDQLIDGMMKDIGADLNIGIKVQDVATQEVIYSRNADRSYIPASNQKIFTAAAALIVLGVDYTFKTQLLTQKPTLQAGVLSGDLFVHFSGDPSLQTTHLAALLKQLKSQGLTGISGNVYLDSSAFEPQLIGDGWMWDDTQYCFAPPISANMLNQNCLQFFISPGSSVGAPLQVQRNQSNQYLLLQNETETRASNARGCQLKLRDVYQNQYQLSGCLPQSSKGAGMSVALTDPNYYALAIVKGLLADQQITVKGRVQLGTNGADLSKMVVIAEKQSEPLSKLIHTMLKESDNIIAETVFKKMGGVYFNSSGSWERGSKAVRTLFTKNAKMSFTNAVIADGSGLSRYNLITPDQVVDLLTYVYHNEQISQTFVAALPNGGIDGSLKYRLKSPAVMGKVWAKTGSMANVVSLSGYIKTNQKRVLAFSILINGAAGSLQKYRKIQDAVCESLAKQY